MLMVFLETKDHCHTRCCFRRGHHVLSTTHFDFTGTKLFEFFSSGAIECGSNIRHCHCSGRDPRPCFNSSNITRYFLNWVIFSTWEPRKDDLQKSWAIHLWTGGNILWRCYYVSPSQDISSSSQVDSSSPVRDGSSSNQGGFSPSLEDDSRGENWCLRTHCLTDIYNHTSTGTSMSCVVVTHKGCTLRIAIMPSEPAMVAQALKSDHYEEWKKSVMEESHCWKRNMDVWEAAPRRATVKNKWISKIKVQSSGGIERLKECVGEMWPSFNLGPVYTMKSKHGRWPFSMVQVHGSASMVRLLKNPVFKALGSSLGLNRMWIKKNDHAPKGECTEFF